MKPALQLPALDPAQIDAQTGSSYPAPLRDRVTGRSRRRLGDAAGLKHFGVNLVELAPGSRSSLRHYHSTQDEFIYVLEGELILISNAGEQRLPAGSAAGFPAGVADGHCLENRSGRMVRYLEIGDRTANDAPTYPDDDLAAILQDGRYVFTHKDGTPY